MSYFDKVRVRIAPSPTGDPHVGTAYITLFNYVFAKKHQGDLILRIEDTDQQRARASSEGLIMKSLEWLGLKWDEGPDVGGDYGPYHQSKRTEIYRKHADMLINSGHAYHCFCTSERLTELRREQMTEGRATGYDRFCRSLSAEEVQRRLSGGEPHVIRLKMPLDGLTTFRDEIRGDVSIENHLIDDQVLMKSDGFPTYHLANVVDDHLMKISHVIRAEEWISSTPKHVALYNAFGWELPQFAHMPLLRNTDRSKISKRKSPISLEFYRRKGILAPALVNFLGLMGWSFGNDVEIFTLEEMTKKFDFKGVHLGGPVFDLEKLAWLNSHYIKQMDDESFVNYLQTELFSPDTLQAIRPLVLERLSTFDQFVDQFAFFFNGSLNYAGLALIPEKVGREVFTSVMQSLLAKLDELYTWDFEHIHKLLDEHRSEHNIKAKDFFMPLRLIMTGRKDSPPLIESIVTLGREISRFRLRCALKDIEEGKI